MSVDNLEQLFINELKDLYSAEKQITKALPKMAKAAKSQELREAFQEHLEQTKGHIERLDEIFEELGKTSRGKTCHGMQGIIEEGQEAMQEAEKGEVRDAALISAAQRVEHYEIAAYGTVRTYANLLGQKNAVKLLEQTLDEEKETDEKLTGIAEQINPDAMEQAA
jgi:ferritin-like metal-binding protein YciE